MRARVRVTFSRANVVSARVRPPTGKGNSLGKRLGRTGRARSLIQDESRRQRAYWREFW